MSSPRLRKQFEILFEHFGGNNAQTQLDDITDILFCTRRNARIVLNKLEEEDWIEWHPSAGRGKLSQLIFKRNRNDVSETLAKKYIEEGRIEQALQVLDRDTNKLSQVIQGYLGISQSEGKQVIRLPYYRALSMLNPAKQMRRSEIHIARQVFSGLTKLDENDQLLPDLAHHWQALSPRHWRFYIRPGVRFHNGEQLTEQDIVRTILSLKRTLLFSHLQHVASPSPWVVDVFFNSDDYHAPFMFADNMAKILPPESMRGENFDRMPIGTGPYRVTKNDDKKLVLSAFGGYFGYQPLLDTVEVWVADNTYSSLVFPSLSDPISGAREQLHDDIDLDPGCTYLLLNRANGIAKSDDWAGYLSQKLNSLAVFRILPDSTIHEMGMVPAHGLKPGWYHQSSEFDLPRRVPPDHAKQIRIAYYQQHPTFPEIANCIEDILAQDCLSVKLVPYSEIPPSADQIDVWIHPMSIATQKEEALVAWLLGYSDIEKFAKPQHFAQWRDLVDVWRQQADGKFLAQKLSKSLIRKHQIIPMFHCWMGISKDHCGSLQNAKCNALGWFDFAKVWVKPEQTQDPI